MSETREFPTEVIASITTGVLLCDFSKMHEAAEYIMGHPIWTHHFANKQLWADMKAAVLEQCPGLPTEINGVSKENWQQHRDNIIAEIGPIVRLRKGGGLTAMHPLDGIPSHAEVIAVAVPRKDGAP